MVSNENIDNKRDSRNWTKNWSSKKLFNIKLIANRKT